MKLKLIVGLIGFLCFIFVTQSEAVENVYTLVDCFKAALQRSETIADQAEQIIQAEEHYQQALAGLLPNLSLYGSYARQAESNHAASEQSLAKLTLTQPLFRGFREYAALRQTQALITAQKEARQWAGLQLYSDMAQSFYTVLALEKDLAHVDAQLQLYLQRIHDLNARVQIGRSRPSEVLSVQSAQAQLKAQRQQINSQLLVSREMLGFLTGLPTTIALSDPMTLPTSIDSLEIYLQDLERRPDVIAARQQLEAASAEIEIARGGHWPSADLSGNYYLDRPEPMQDVTWDAQIALTLPLFAGGLIVSQTKEAESRYHQTELALQRLQRLNQTILRQNYSQLQADQEQIVALEEAADLAHKNYLAVLRDYNLGLLTTLDVLQAMAADQDTQRSLDQARYNRQIVYEQLEALSAKRLGLLGGL